jgi:hypothetical protein
VDNLLPVSEFYEAVTGNTGYGARRLCAGRPGSCRCVCSRSDECDVGHDAAFVVGHVAESASDTLGLLDDPVEARSLESNRARHLSCRERRDPE